MNIQSESWDGYHADYLENNEKKTTIQHRIELGLTRLQRYRGQDFTKSGIYHYTSIKDSPQDAAFAETEILSKKYFNGNLSIKRDYHIFPNFGTFNENNADRSTHAM